MKSFDEFRSFIAEQLKDELDGLEERRNKMFTWKAKLGAFLGVAVIIHWGVCLFTALPTYTILITIVLGTAIAYFVFNKYFLDLAIPSNFKDLIVKSLVSFVDPSLQYDPTGHISYEDYRASELFLLKPDHFTGDDLIEGSIEGIPIKFSELISSYEKEHPGVSKSKAWEMIFHGLFLVAEIPYEFKGKVFVLSSTIYKHLGYTGRLVQKHNFFRGHYILPKNLDFRDNFVVYAENLLEGELILTGNFMDKILKLKKTTKAEVYISMIGNKVYVGVNLNREIFKISLNKPLTRVEYLKSFYNDLYYMLTVIEELNLEAFLENQEN
ncbi:DUF3137 domain-containing protein [Flexithrix dorotheae]|uniref:DUF3137 domain-containing protein n=1 Tax=Flexithrix dorotheae TaxID=70993 RepID=UPI000382E4DF|nr:DUF3137 domain-containing protein [Flexithrix dorotheae]